MADDWEVEDETPVDQWQGSTAAPVAAGSQGGGGWEVESETPAQVYKVNKAAAAKPKDTRQRGLKGELLGAAKGGAELYDKLIQRIGTIPGVQELATAPGSNPLRGMFGVDKQQLQGRALPAIHEAEKTIRPGGIGTFIGQQAALLPFGGPVTSGLVQGVAESNAAPGDWGSVAKDAVISATLNKVGAFAAEPIARAVGGQVVKGLTKFNPAKAIPALRQAKDAAYQKVRDLGVVYTPEATQRLEQGVAKTLHDFGASKVMDTPAFARAAQLTEKVKKGLPLTLDEVETMKQEVYATVRNPELRDRMAKQFVDFINKAGGQDIAVPPGGAAADALAQQGKLAIEAARRAHKRFTNVELVHTKLAGAESKAKRVYRGSNLDNKIRQVFGPLADADSKKNIQRFLHPDAAAQLEKVVEGDWGRDALRTIGQFTPFSLKGVAAGSLSGGATIVPGLLAKHFANKETRKAVSDLMEMIASGGSKQRMLAVRKLRERALRDSDVGKFITALEQDAAETAGRALSSAQIADRNRSQRELLEAKARAQARGG